jgi:hypothetical protein
MSEAVHPFWQKHRGGSGAVVVVFAINEETNEEQVEVFSCIENAEAWGETLGPEWNCVFSPKVVDHPDFGHATVN